MRRMLLVVMVFSLLAGLPQAMVCAEQDGRPIFNGLKCNLCHKLDKKAAGPSLSEIAEAYAGKEAELVRYFKGEAPPIIDPSKAGAMRGPLEKTRVLPATDVNALVNYLLQPGE